MKQIDPRILLKIHVNGVPELWDDRTQTFHSIPDADLTFEHSLVSVSKWEAIYHKPFLTRDEKSPQEMLDYLRCMTIEENVDPLVYSQLTKEDYEKINAYIMDKASGTTITDRKKGGGRKNNQIETAEVIYWEMFHFYIPIEWEHRHFNQLRTLIQVCSSEENGGEAMSRRDVTKMYSEINAARRAKYHSAG